MNQRKYFFTTLLLAIALILCIAAFSFAVNKLKFSSDKLLSNVDAREYNSVIAVKHAYDALILGSSMSQGFHCSDMDAAYKCQSLKLACSGATLAEIEFLAEYACKHKKLKYILFDCNIYALGKEQELEEMPVQLYSSDANFYLLKKSFSINLLLDNLDFISRYLRGKIKTVSRDDLYDWNSPKSCGEEQLAREIIFKPYKVFSYDNEFISQAEEHVKKHLFPLFKAHPDIRFILFFPPYSAMFYKGADFAGYIKLKEKIMDLLLSQKNVELHDFQTEFSITENLNIYRDQTHYSGKINSWMIAQTVKKTHLVTPDNKKQLLAKHLEQLKRYDYQGTYDKLKKQYGNKKKNKKKKK